MQEEVEQKSVALSIKATKLTAQVLAKAIAAAMRGIKKARDAPKHGKQSVKKLSRQNTGLQSIEITDDNIKSFDRVARKYGVDYALKRDDGTAPPRWLVFFKARDTDALTAAFNEFTRDTLRREQKPSVREAMRSFKELVANAVLDRTPKQRERGERSGRGGPEL